MEITIRPIRPEDCQAVTELWNHELGNWDVTAENLAVTLAKMEKAGIYTTLVALADGRAAGFITMVEVMAAGFPVGYLKINGLAVKEAFQRQGIGAQLLKAAEALAAQKGISHIGLASGFKRTAAHTFYERQGYVKGSYYFSKEV